MSNAAQIDDIFRRQLELMAEAQAAGVVIKANMPSNKEINAYKTRASCTVAHDGPGRTLVHPAPTATGQFFKA